MEHENVMAERVAEKYVLDELSFDEREEFEEHFFVCTRCADSVREITAFVDSATAAVRRDSREASSEKVGERTSDVTWFRKLVDAFRRPLVIGLVSCIAAVIILLIDVIQLRKQIVGISAPQVLASVTLVAGTRGSGPAILTIRSRDSFFELVLDVPEERAGSYTFQVFAPDQEVVSSGSIAALGGEEPLHLLLPSKRFASGVYTIRLHSGGQTTPEIYTFQIQKAGSTK